GVYDDLGQRADRNVEVAALLDPEALRHRDLDRLEVVPAPYGLEHRVHEPEVEDLNEAELPQVVVDPVQLRLIYVPVQLGGQLPGRRQVVPEGFLDDDASRLRQSRVRQALHDRAKERGRDLQVEDG